MGAVERKIDDHLRDSVGETLLPLKQHSFGWAMYAACSVLYEGRAASTLALGNYLIITKSDGSVSIHGATLVLPRNYLASASLLSIEGNRLTFHRKKETIVITVLEVHWLQALDGWSDSKIVICRTEKELARKIFDNWCDFFPDEDFEIIELEHPTELGPIDILGLTATTDFVVEVKRKRASIKDVTQLLRYIEAKSGSRLVKGYLAAPSIGGSAMKYLEKHGLIFLHVNFDTHGTDPLRNHGQPLRPDADGDAPDRGPLHGYFQPQPG